MAPGVARAAVRRSQTARRDALGPPTLGARIMSRPRQPTEPRSLASDCQVSKAWPLLQAKVHFNCRDHTNWRAVFLPRFKAPGVDRAYSVGVQSRIQRLSHLNVLSHANLADFHL